MTTDLAPGGNRLIFATVYLVVILAVIATGCRKSAPATPPNQSTADWKLDLKMEPDHLRMVRPATFILHVSDNSGRPVENVHVAGSLNMMLMNMGKTDVKFESKGRGDYQATVQSFDMSGPWELTVDATQGTLQQHKVFQFTVLD